MKTLIKKQIKITAIGDILSRVPLLIIDLFLAKTIGLVSYGQWSTFQLFINYNNFLHLGSLSTMSRKTPEYKKNNKSLKKLLLYVFSFIHIMAIVYSLLIFGLVFCGILDMNYFQLVILIFLIFVQIEYQFYQIYLQSNYHFLFSTISKNIYAVSFLFQVMILYIINVLNVTSIMFTFMLSYFFSLVYLHYKSKLCFHLNITKMNRSYIKKILVIGFPSYFLGLTKLLNTSIDRFFILYDLGFKSLGLYSFSFMFSVIFGMIGGILITVVSPYIMAKNDIKNDIFLIIKYFYILMSISYLFILIIFVAYFILLKYGLYLDAYGEGYWITLILLTTSANMLFIQYVSIFLYKLNQQKYLTFYSLFFILFLISSNIYIYLQNINLIGYALSSLMITTIFLLASIVQLIILTNADLKYLLYSFLIILQGNIFIYNFSKGLYLWL